MFYLKKLILPLCYYFYTMHLTDTHIHLYAEEFDTDRETLIRQAINNNVTKFFLPNIDSSSFAGMNALQQYFPENCFPMMGLHPCYVKENYLHELNAVEAELAKQKFYGIGEIGMDLYWDVTFRKQQEEVFIKQIEWANDLKLPIIIHSRNATDEIIEILKQQQHLNPHGIFHCFSGDKKQADEIIALGFALGIGGVVTFKNSGVDKVVGETSLEHIVLETDAPYLAPAPHRGKRNIPDYINLVADKIAAIKNITKEEVAKITSANAEKIFGV
jgi:TatD DNase family protein